MYLITIKNNLKNKELMFYKTINIHSRSFFLHYCVVLLMRRKHQNDLPDEIDKLTHEHLFYFWPQNLPVTGYFK